jgi:predicted enzyme related to lactoylglutathione lyase
MELNTARIFVRDIVEATPFYANKLGLPVKVDQSQRGYCVFKSGNTELVVEVVHADAPEEEQVLVGRFTGLSFSVSNAEQKYVELVSRGVEFIGMPEKQSWGGVLATLRDPAGNQLQIVQREAA